MSVSINIPEELYQQAVALSEIHHVPVEEVFASAFAEQLATWERLSQRALRGNREKYINVLDSVPNIEPDPYDRI
jgi:hypothetical protein